MGIPQVLDYNRIIKAAPEMKKFYNTTSLKKQQENKMLIFCLFLPVDYDLFILYNI